MCRQKSFCMKEQRLYSLFSFRKEKKKVFHSRYSFKFIFTCMIGNTYPTAKFEAQLIRTDILIAETRGPCVNSSATIIHGIDPVRPMLCFISFNWFQSHFAGDTDAYAFFQDRMFSDYTINLHPIKKITLTNFTPTLTLHKHCYLQDVLHPND